MSSRAQYQDHTDRPSHMEKNFGSGVTTPSEYELTPRQATAEDPYVPYSRAPATGKSAQPWYKRPKALIWTLFLIVVVVVAVAVGVYYGLRNRKHDSGGLDLPSMNLATDRGGMEEVGSFLTSSDQSSRAISTLFSWSAGGFTLSAASAGATGVGLLINTSAVQQPMDGFGASLTDSSCYLLYTFKLKNETLYNQTMDYFFNPRTGMSTTRVPIGASDYSNQGEYSYADNNATAAAVAAGNTTSLPSPLASFSLEKAEEYILPVIRDAIARRPDLKIWLTPWSPPAWMKTTNTMNGGQLIYGTEELYAQYLFLTVQAYTRSGIRPYAMTIQNEPSNGAESYPSNWMSPASSTLVASYLRTSLDQGGFEDVKLFANDDNWIDWSAAATAIQSNSTAWSGVAWHGYDGNFSSIATFNATVANVSTPIEQHLTEITTTDSSRNQWWSTQWWLSNNFFGPINLGVRSVMSWNIVLDSDDGPYIDTAPCRDCLGTFEIDSPSAGLDPPVQAGNAQFITVYHFAAATSNLTTFGGGPAYRVSTDLTSSVSPSTRQCIGGISAFVAPYNGTRLANTRLKRVGVVLENDCYNNVQLDIGIQNQRGSFTFRPGLTTLIFNV